MEMNTGSARQLDKILEYSGYGHFKPVIDQAKEAYINSEQRIEDHFEDFLEMVDKGLGAKRSLEDGVKLARWSCHLFATVKTLYFSCFELFRLQHNSGKMQIHH
jgi:hypothetical protein